MDAEEVTVKVCGFLEESPGVRSSSRLYAGILCGAMVGVAACACVYLFRENPNAGVLGSMAGIITALGGALAYVMGKRNT